MGVAKDLILTGRVVDAKEARRIGQGVLQAALDADGRVLALRVASLANLGSSPSITVYAADGSGTLTTPTTSVSGGK